MRMIDKLSKRKTCYVIADQRDNSITLSESLAKRMGVFKRNVTKVFVFYIPAMKEYGFIINPNLGDNVQMGTVQYNTKYKCVGFESLNPTVGVIGYDYGLPYDAVAKLSVRIEPNIIKNKKVFVIERPKL